MLVYLIKSANLLVGQNGFKVFPIAMRKNIKTGG